MVDFFFPEEGAESQGPESLRQPGKAACEIWNGGKVQGRTQEKSL